MEDLTPQSFLAQARQNVERLKQLDIIEVVKYKAKTYKSDEDDFEDDENAEFRFAVIKLLYQTLNNSDRPIIRLLMKQEIRRHINFSDGGLTDSLEMCAFMLYKLANPKDVFLIWKAKCSNYDTACGLDVKYLLGTGMSETLAYLRKISKTKKEKKRKRKKALEILEYIEKRCDWEIPYNPEKFTIGMNRKFEQILQGQQSS